MQSALRQGDYKLYKNLVDGSYELYRLYDGLATVDIEEFHDIAGEVENADILADMTEKLEAHLVKNDVELPSFNPIYSGELALANTDYGIDQIAVFSSELQMTPDGLGTYRITADVLPQSGKSIMSNPENTSWGVASDDQGVLNNKNYIFWASTQDPVWVNNLQVVDFNANGGTYTEDHIVEIYFKSIAFANSGSVGKDAIGITNEDSVYNLGNITALELKDDLSLSSYPVSFSLYSGDSDNMGANK